MKKLICFPLFCVGLLTACVDKNEEVDADSMPEWLHGSIYETLQNPQSNGLDGTFTYYLKLADDLNYKETLSRTGSKTVFPANDSAFVRFFKSNKWGVTSYDQLSTAQKKLLFYNSMLDNALLTSMLSNMMGSSSILNGMSLRHESAVSVIDSVTHVYAPSGLPANNPFWAKHIEGLDVVYDNTKPMMVHFTRDYLLNNNITTSGEVNDFKILTGSDYDANGNNVFVFGDKVIKSDITCQNGYIHQVQDVLMPPGNMAQVIRENSNLSYFSRMLDYFSAPYFDQATTNSYNDWAVANGQPLKDSIFQVRYLSSNSQGNSLNISPDNTTQQNLLTFDPGWNQYYNNEGRATSSDNVKDMAAMFVPDDNAIKAYFGESGNGAYIMDIYGDLPNTEANLSANLDALYNKQPGIVRDFVRNLQQKSFINSVPSKFSTVTNTATENMGMNMSYLKQKDDGTYDLTIANNGVVYVLNEMIAPDELQTVMAPAKIYPDMHVMDWCVQDTKYLGVDFVYYLQAVSANYAFFIPDDQAFDYHVTDTILGHKHEGKGDFNAYYVDPTSLGSSQPVALRFTYNASKKPELQVKKFNYDPDTHMVGDSLSESVSVENVTTQLVDLLNYHTVVLSTGEEIGAKHYYKTKHGGEIYVSGNTVGSTVYSGEQVDNEALRPSIERDWSEKNGHAYRLNGIIQTPTNSVRTTLEQHEDRFGLFLDLCDRFNGASDIMKWANISDEIGKFGTSDQERYLIFTTTYGNETSGVANACLGDGNVKFFNTYNYTLYAPNNNAMQEAFAAGLPTWDQVEALYNKYEHEDGSDENISDAEKNDKEQAYTMINSIREFIRYHFQSVSIYADKTVDTGNYATFHSDDLGVAQKLTVSFSTPDKFTVTDAAGVQHVIGQSGKLTNLMTRDFWFSKARTEKNNSIVTSSFCAVHEIDKPLSMYAKSSDGQVHYDTWNRNGLQKAYNYFKRLNANTK